MTRPFRRANLHGRFVRALLLGLVAVSLLGQANDCFAGKKKRTPPQSPEEQMAIALRYMPEGTAVIGSVDVPAVLRSELIRNAARGNLAEIAESSEEIRATIGVSLEQISRVTLGGMAGDDEPKGVLVVHLKEAVDPAECLKLAKESSSASWDEETIGTHKIHIKGGDDIALHWVDQRTLLVAKPRMFLAVLARKKPARLSPRMEAARASLDLSQTMAFAVALEELLEDNAYRQYVPISDEVLDGIGAITFSADFDADLTLKLAAVCDNESIAWQLKGLIGGVWQLALNQIEEGNLGDTPASALEVARSVRLEVSEQTFSISARIPAAVYAEMTDSKMARAEIGGQTMPSPFYLAHDIPTPVKDSDEEEDDAPKLEASYANPQPWDPYAASPAGDTPAKPSAGSIATTYDRFPSGRPGSYLPGSTAGYNCRPRVCSSSSCQPAVGYTASSPYNASATATSGCTPNTYAAAPSGYAANSTTPYANTYPTYPRQPTPPLDGILGEVARMASAGLDEEVILAHIRCHVDRGGTVPVPDADDLIALHKSEATAGVLLGLMQLALEQEQASEEREETATGRLMFSAVMPSYTGDALLRADTVQVAFVDPVGARIASETDHPLNPVSLICPGRESFYPGIHRLKLSSLPDRPGVVLHPTLEIGPTTSRTEKFLAHNAIPVQFTEEDLDNVMSGGFVTKVVYLPDPEFQELAQSGVETLVSTRLDPGVDPIIEADRRGAILAIVRLGSKSELPGFTMSPPHGLPTSGTPIGLPGPPRVPLPPPGVAPPQYGLPADGRPIGLPRPPLSWQNETTDSEREMLAYFEFSDFSFYRLEFVGDTAELTPAGRTHLMQLASRLDDAPFPVIVEQASGDGNRALDHRRRKAVVDLLTQAGITGHENRVVIAPMVTPLAPLPPPKMVPLPVPTPDARPIRSARRLPHWLRPVSTQPTPVRRTRTLPTDDASMKRLIDEWERIWLLDQPDHVLPRRTHGGIL